MEIIIIIFVLVSAATFWNTFILTTYFYEIVNINTNQIYVERLEDEVAVLKTKINKINNEGLYKIKFDLFKDTNECYLRLDRVTHSYTLSSDKYHNDITPVIFELEEANKIINQNGLQNIVTLERV